MNVNELKVGEAKELALSTLKNDYWFMTNLLENYSTNKEEAIKDCVERMKFRQPFFKSKDYEALKGAAK